jgi:ribosome production factor 2
MYEFGAESYQSIDDFTGAKKGLGSKPILSFVGEQWEHDSTFASIQNFFVDFFRGDRPEKISMKGIDHVISFSYIDSKVLVRSHIITYEKSESKVRIILKLY